MSILLRIKLLTLYDIFLKFSTYSGRHNSFSLDEAGLTKNKSIESFSSRPLSTLASLFCSYIRHFLVRPVTRDNTIYFPFLIMRTWYSRSTICIIWFTSSSAPPSSFSNTITLPSLCFLRLLERT